MAVTAVQFFGALAERSRLRIVRLLQAGPLTVGAVAGVAGLPLMGASSHLRVLRAAGLVTRRKFGRHVEYALNPVAYSPGPPASFSRGGVRVVLPAVVRPTDREAENREAGRNG
jgi:DNA-binding transcriptional ArsR family regulator